MECRGFPGPGWRGTEGRWKDRRLWQTRQGSDSTEEKQVASGSTRPRGLLESSASEGGSRARQRLEEEENE